MRVKPVWAVVFLAMGAAACGGGGDPGPGGGGGGEGPCAGIERVCATSAECPSLEVCSNCGDCVTDPGVRACENTADCPIGRACRVPEGADALACVRVVCDTHADCVEGEACDATRHACVPGDCVSLGCPEGTHCRVEDSTCVECLSNPDCAGTDRPYCAEAINTCVVCEYDSDCGSGKVCADHACVACARDEDCSAAAPICRDDGRCVTCLADGDCPAGVACLESGRCDLGPIAGEACDPGRVCAPGHRCEGDGAGVCFLSCDPYAPACGEGEVCTFLGDDEGAIRMANGRPIGVCLRGDAGQDPGAVCGGARECRADLLCLPDDATTDRCRPPCNPASSGTGGCATGEVCKGLPLGSGGAPVGFCLRPTAWLDPCHNNADCGAGLGCEPSLEGNAIVPRCDFASGTGDALAACDADADCRSGLCLAYDDTPTFCFGACEADADCGFGTCGTLDFVLEGGVTATTAACRATCDQDADCAGFQNFICAIGVDGDDQLFAECAARSGTGTAGAGAFCTADSQCKMGLCFDDGGPTGVAEDGFCLGPCAGDADCGTGTVCRAAPLLVNQEPVTYAAIDVCWGAACGANADCPAGRMCDFEPDPANLNGAVRFSCAPAYGDLLPGAACTAHTECMSGICVPLWTGEQICFGPCRTSSDCEPGTYCDPQAFTYSTPNGSAVSLPGCVTF